MPCLVCMALTFVHRLAFIVRTVAFGNLLIRWCGRNLQSSGGSIWPAHQKIDHASSIASIRSYPWSRRMTCSTFEFDAVFELLKYPSLAEGAAVTGAARTLRSCHVSSCRCPGTCRKTSRGSSAAG